MARPSEYNETYVTRTKEYLANCVDQIEEYHKTRGEKSDSYERIIRVKIPTIEGLAYFLSLSKNTIYEWEKIHPEFSDVIEDLRCKQAQSLIEGGLSGDYNPTIAKVLLTKHGYREGVDQTTNGKDLPVPILGNVPSNYSNQEDSILNQAN